MSLSSYPVFETVDFIFITYFFWFRNIRTGKLYDFPNCALFSFNKIQDIAEYSLCHYILYDARIRMMLHTHFGVQHYISILF